ncbi:MAG: hypothetical protein MZV70_07360 [Desulfobacterales bacterium]|nr:hypothetical protein [Desulfobacterales bacterium]
MDPGPPAAGALEPADQCGRSHRGPRARSGSSSSIAKDRQACLTDRRLRRRNGAGDPQVDFRPLFHHQAERHRPGAVHRPPHSRRLRLPPGRGERTRPRDDLQPALAADRPAGATRR